MNSNQNLQFSGAPGILEATENGQLNYVIYHIESGANPNQKDSKNDKTLLYIATERGYFQLVKYLIKKGAEINLKSDSQTPLHIAYKQEHLEIFHFLILHGADLEAKDGKNQTVSQLAMEAGISFSMSFILTVLTLICILPLNMATFKM
jgi:ankyrin repeat protein